MSERNETLAEIVEEMRKRMKSHYYSREGRNLMWQYFDRIEAAAKREREAWEEAACRCVSEAVMSGKVAVVHPTSEKSSAVGSAAAMREAMVKIKDINGGRPDDAAGYEINDIIDAALSAPPRNCDRFGGDIDKLREACLRERGLNPEDDFPEWLLAPSTEGGAL